MGFAWHDAIGGLGVAIIVLTYLLLQLERLDARGLSYSFLNGIGAALVIFSLMYEFNLSAFLIELFWLLISLLGLVMWVRRKSNQEE
ncbi:MAG: hypothetical protein V3T15_07820 [Pseudomonadales bacterium]